MQNIGVHLDSLAFKESEQLEVEKSKITVRLKTLNPVFLRPPDVRYHGQLAVQRYLVVPALTDINKNKINSSTISRPRRLQTALA